MRQWLRRRAAGRAPAAPGSAPPGAGQPVGPVDRLGVDGVPVPVRQRFEPFQQDVRAGRLALLRTESAPSAPRHGKTRCSGWPSPTSGTWPT